MKWSKEIEESGKVTISLRQYEELLERDFYMSWLESTGVDNWVGWDTISYMPEFRQFDGTVEEYAAQWEEALGSVY